MSQLQLLRDRSLWPLFWSQFIAVSAAYAVRGAILARAFQVEFLGIHGPLGAFAFCGIASALGALLGAGLSYRVSRNRAPLQVLRMVHAVGPLALLCSGWGVLAGNAPAVIAGLALLGVQAALSSAYQAALLPTAVDRDELFPANALTLVGSLAAATLGAVLGLLSPDELGLPAVLVLTAYGAGAPLLAWLQINRTVVSEPVPSSRAEVWPAKGNRNGTLSNLGVAWFGFIVVAVLVLALRASTSAPDAAADGLPLVSLRWGLVFALGCTIGAFCCDRLSLQRLELGVVPTGTIGMTVFLGDLVISSAPFPALDVSLASTLRGTFDLFGVGFFAGIYVVPLRAVLLHRTHPEQRVASFLFGQIALAAFCLVAFVLFTPLDTGSGRLSLLLLLALNLGVTFYCYRLLPEFLLRFVLWCVSRVMYRVRVMGAEFLPPVGACVLVCNHVSFVDWMIIAAASPRPVRFVMYHRYFNLPVVRFLLRDAQVIPIAPAHEDAGVLEEAYDAIARALEQGEVVCVFPEGKLTTDGNLNPFRSGIERIVARTPVPVVPMALDGMWGSYFSKKDGQHFQRPFRRLWSKVQLVVGPPVAPNDVSATKLERLVAGLGGFEVRSC